MEIMHKEKFSICILWTFTVLFFAYQFILRLSPGVLIDEVMIKYQISASTFGLIISFYYAGYAGMQIPIGVMLDRFGIRYTVAASAIVCVLGNVPLILSDHWVAALIGRFLIGAGSAAGALGAIHAVRLNFDQKHISKMIALTVTIGLLGGIYGKSINRFFLNSYGMYESIIFLAMPGIAIAAGLIFFAKDGKNKSSLSNKYSVWSSLKKVLKDSQVILLAIAGGLMIGPLSAFADIFGEPFLVTVYNFSPAHAGQLTASTIYIGMCVGAPLLATIADRFRCHYIINITCGLVMAGIFYLILEKLVSGYLQMFVGAFIVGIMCAYQVIVISIVSTLVPANVNGIAIAVVNMLNMLAGTAYNLMIGNLLDYYWTGEIMHGKRIYSEIAYADALYILPISLMLGSIIFFAIKPRPGIC